MVIRVKKIIGIIANTIGFDSNNPFDDKYFAQNNYVIKIKKLGGIPIIIPHVDMQINYDALDLCDAFLITGGKDIHKYHLDVIEYAMNKNKKLLGICMGMQAIGMSSNNDYNEETLVKVDNHYNDDITHLEKELLIHEVEFENDSLLYDLLGKRMMVNSIHRYALMSVSYPFKVVGKCGDIIEAIEYKNIIGVQFHPELMTSADNLFKWLMK